MKTKYGFKGECAIRFYKNFNSAKAVVGSVTLNFGLFYHCLFGATIMVLDYQSKFACTFVNTTVVNNTHICRWNETCA